MRQPLLHEENIVVGLQAKNSEDALRKLVAVLPAWRVDQATKNNIWKTLVLRERLGTTAIGRGIALPHCTSSVIDKPLVLFGVSSEGIPYSSLDGYPVHFIFLLILPQMESSERIKREILKNIKWLLCDRFLQGRLKAAHSGQKVATLLSLKKDPNWLFKYDAVSV